MTTTVTRFTVMVRQLRGLPLPPLPAIPGRVHMAPNPEGDPLAERWDADSALLSTLLQNPERTHP